MEANVVYYMDCLEYMSNIQQDSIDLIIEDPPYGVNFDNIHYNDKQKTIIHLAREWYEIKYKLLKNHSHVYIFVPSKIIHKWLNILVEFFELINILSVRCYETNKFSQPNNFDYSNQLILYMSKSTPKNFNVVNWVKTSDTWLNDKRNNNKKEFRYIYPSYIESKTAFANIKANANIKRLHENEKNPELIAYFIQISSNVGENVMDTFAGSGSTYLSCLKTNRNYYGCDNNKECVEIANSRKFNIYTDGIKINDKVLKTKKITDI